LKLVGGNQTEANQLVAQPQGFLFDRLSRVTGLTAAEDGAVAFIVYIFSHNSIKYTKKYDFALPLLRGMNFTRPCGEA
jgi:hypothetical protein